METTSLPSDGQISGNVLFYSNPEPLSLEMHRNLKMVRSDTPYGFARAAHVVPLQVTEFGPASLTYPIIFAGDAYQPLAVMSIRPNENLFVSEDGRFEADAYVPAYIRRYPFVLANNEAQGQLVVCIDRGASVFQPGGEVAMFENGKPTEFTESCIKFCSDFEAERLRTESFVKTMRELDLLDTRTTMFTPTNADGSPAEPVQIAEFFAVSEEKLNALPTDKLLDLRATGALQQIYVHLNSLFNWDRLITKTLIRYPEPPAANSN